MMFFQPRHFARWRSERVSSTDDTNSPHGNDDTASPASSNNDEEGSFINSSNSSTSTTVTTATPSAVRVSNNQTAASERPDASSIDIEAGDGRATTSATTNTTTTSTEQADDSTDSDADEDDVAEGVTRYTVRHTMSLAELEEERELARRRSSACVLFALFVLFRLWILALQEGDFGLLLLCVVGSSWTARWIRYNRDQEEELDRRIANYLSNPEGGGDGSTTQVPRDDLRMLSFQAQLALAIMESQRQMMQGGYGHPDGNGNSSPGVSESAQNKWTKFTYKASRDKKESRKGSYGSVAQQDVTKPGSGGDEEPHCSICLGEYEDGEGLSKLPCSHIYHDECISSWCSNHVRCPLCNYDLESEPADEVV